MSAIQTSPMREVRRKIADERSMRVLHASRWTHGAEAALGGTSSDGFSVPGDREKRAP